MKRSRLVLSTLALTLGLGLGSAVQAATNAAPTLTPAEFEKAKSMYFQRRAGCRGCAA